MELGIVIALVIAVIVAVVALDVFGAGWLLRRMWRGERAGRKPH